MPNLAEYTLNQLQGLNEKELNKFDSPIKHVKKQYLEYGSIGLGTIKDEVWGTPRETVKYGWFPITKEKYIKIKNNINVEVKVDLVKENVKLLDDFNNTKNLKQKAKLANLLADKSFELTNQLYDLSENYKIEWLEDKAEMFENLTQKYNRLATEYTENYEKEILNKKQLNKEIRIEKLRTEKEKIETEMARLLINN